MPIQIRNDTLLALGFMAGRVRKSGHHLTLIVKGAFQLRPGPSSFAPERPLLSGDVKRDEDAPSSLVYGSDFAPFKPRADFTLTGTAHPADGRARREGRVTVKLGAWQKTLLLFGDRHFIPRGAGRWDITEAQPFRALPSSYERAFGGAGRPNNPVGRGMAAEPHGGILLPNWELPSSPIRSPSDRPEPAGFGPLDRAWPQRADKLGTYDAAWLADRWPYFPDDFDWSYFNAAPVDQQMPYLRGDEALVLEGFFEGGAHFASSLPGIRPRCFLRHRAKGAEAVEEVRLSLDTVHADTDASMLTLVWRGLFPVRSREHDEVDQALLVVEPLAEPPRPAEDYLAPERWTVASTVEGLADAEDAAARGGPVEMPKAAPAVDAPDPEEVAALDAEREELAKAGVDRAILDRLTGVTKASVFAGILIANIPAQEGEPAASAAGEAAFDARLEKARELDARRAELREAGVDPALSKKLEEERTRSGFLRVLVGGLPPPGSPEEVGEREALVRDLHDAERLERSEDLAAEAKPRAARGERLTRDEAIALVVTGQGLAGANLAGLDLSGTDLSGANLAGANLSSTILVGASLRGADLTGAELRLADLTEASLIDAIAQDATCEGVTLERADLTGAALARAVLRAAKLDGAKLDGADLAGADLEGSSLRAASLKAARLDGAQLREVDLRAAKAPKVSLRGATLEGAHLEGAALDGALFIESRLARATLDGASLRDAFFEDASGADASFRGADLRGARAGRARLSGGCFASANAEGASFAGAELTGCDFEGASLRGASFVAASASSGSFHLAKLEEANLSKAVLCAAKLTRANLFRARLGGADLTGADCRASNLFECDLFEATTQGARFERANLSRTRLADRSAR